MVSGICSPLTEWKVEATFLGPKMASGLYLFLPSSLRILYKNPGNAKMVTRINIFFIEEPFIKPAACEDAKSLPQLASIQ
ncbi:hypothetical protein D3C72_2366400 [compost metagenome]